MTAPPMSATTAAVSARCGGAAHDQVDKDPSDWSGPARSCDNHVFKEPVMKEKLKYLRYFRLVTHRKKNGKLATCSRAEWRVQNDVSLIFQGILRKGTGVGIRTEIRRAPAARPCGSPWRLRRRPCRRRRRRRRRIRWQSAGRTCFPRRRRASRRNPVRPRWPSWAPSGCGECRRRRSKARKKANAVMSKWNPEGSLRVEGGTIGFST